MVMDFGFLKDVMMQEIHAPCDHGLILYEEDHSVLRTLKSTMWTDRGGEERLGDWLKLYLMDGVPTAENLARHWFERVHYGIGAWCTAHDIRLQGVKLQKVRVYETPNCYADYPA